MIPQIKQYIHENWSIFFETKPESIQALLLSNPQGKKITKSKCTVLIFKNEEQTPSIVAKFMRAQNSELARLQVEHELLNGLKESKYAQFVPKSYSYVEINNRKVTFESYIPLNSIKSNLQKKVNALQLDELSLVMDQMQNDFHQVAKLREEMDHFYQIPTMKEINYVSDSISNIDQLVQVLELEESQSELLQSIVADYQEYDRVTSFVHFDFTPSNIFQDINHYKMIDFEFSNFSKDRFIDPMRFLFYYFYLLYELGIFHDMSFEESFYSFFEKDIQVQPIIHEFFDKTVGLDDEFNFFEYMALFLVCNLQLQLTESSIMNEAFIKQTRSLLILCLKISDDQEVLLADLESSIEEKQDFSLEGQYRKIIKEKDKGLQQNIEYIEQCHTVIAQKDQQLQQNIEYIEQCHTVIQSKDEQLQQNVDYIEHCHTVISTKDQQIEELNLLLSQFRK